MQSMIYDVHILYTNGAGLQTTTAYEVSLEEAERLYGGICGDLVSIEICKSDLLGVMKK